MTHRFVSISVLYPVERGRSALELKNKTSCCEVEHREASAVRKPGLLQNKAEDPSNTLLLPPSQGLTQHTPCRQSSCVLGSL